MEYKHSIEFGKKIFFIAPSFMIKKMVVPRLVENEYETYIIANYEDAKNVLKMYPYSICFINIDESMSHTFWYNYIKSFEADDELSTVLTSVISSNLSKELKTKYMNNLKLEAGFVPLHDSADDLYTTIENILQSHKAKGRRQYVRASCASHSDALMIVQENSKAYKLDLLDISVVGTACSVSVADKDAFTVNSVLRNATITLGKKNFSVDAVVFAVIPTENFCKLVLLFIQPVDVNTKQIIRNFISVSLQDEIENIIKNSTPDTQDYSKSITDDNIEEI